MCVLFFLVKIYAVALQWPKKDLQKCYLLPLFSARQDEQILPKKNVLFTAPKARHFL